MRILRALRQSCIGVNVARTDAGAAVARGRRSLVAEPAQPDPAVNARASQVARVARLRTLPRAPGVKYWVAAQRLQQAATHALAFANARNNKDACAFLHRHSDFNRHRYHTRAAVCAVSVSVGAVEK